MSTLIRALPVFPRAQSPPGISTAATSAASMVLFRFIVFGFSGLFIQHHDRIGVGALCRQSAQPGPAVPARRGRCGAALRGCSPRRGRPRAKPCGLGKPSPSRPHAGPHAAARHPYWRYGARRSASRLRVAVTSSTPSAPSTSQPTVRDGGVPQPSAAHNRGHPPHLGRGEENLPLIPAVVVLPVGLQGIGRAGGQHEVAHAAHGVLKRDVSQHALHVVAVAVLLEDGAFHRGGGVPPEEQLAHTAQFGLDLPAAGELVGPRMVVPIVGFAVQGTERPFHARRIGTPPRRGDQFHRRVFALMASCSRLKRST